MNAFKAKSVREKRWADSWKTLQAPSFSAQKRRLQLALLSLQPIVGFRGAD